jgi:leader peptidase (prepilin peptidase)/N-methyltransferase
MLVAAIAFLFGCCVGSFLNVCIHRLPRNLSVVHPPSRCGACGTRIAAYDNVPVLAWLWLRGRCRHCGTPFSIRYPAVELLTGLLAALVAWQAFHDAPSWLALHVGEVAAAGLRTAALLVVTWYLLASALIDLDHTIIPDELTKPMLWLAPLLALGAGVQLDLLPFSVGWLARRDLFGEWSATPGTFVLYVGLIGGAALALTLASLPVCAALERRLPERERWPAADRRGFAVGVLWFAAGAALPWAAALATAASAPVLAAALAQSALGMCAGWWLILLPGLVGTAVLGRNAMGFGDAKFLAPIGAVLGPAGVALAFGVAVLSATIAAVPMTLWGRGASIPFGPSLALGAFAVLVAGDALLAALAALFPAVGG